MKSHVEYYFSSSLRLSAAAVCWSGPSSLSSSTCWRCCLSGTNRSPTSQKVQSPQFTPVHPSSPQFTPVHPVVCSHWSGAPDRAPSYLIFVTVFKEAGWIRCFSVFRVSPVDCWGLIIPPLTGEQQQFGFCYILGDYWSEMKCWLTVLSVNKSQMAAVGSELSPFLIAEISKL